jgi:hypothetical protein
MCRRRSDIAPILGVLECPTLFALEVTVGIKETASISIACLSLLAVSMLAGCPPTGPTGPTNPGPSAGCSACLDSSGCAGDPGCSQAKCGFVCSSPQGADQCAGCKQECGSNTQCYQANCVSLCPQLETCQSCTQNHCNGEANPAPCIQEKCAAVCAIDAGVPDGNN